MVRRPTRYSPPPRELAAALGLVLTVVAGCGEGESGRGDAAGLPDLAPPGVSGEVAGRPLRLLAGRVEDDMTCGARGLALVLTAEPGCARADGGPGAEEALRVLLSDRLPGVYLFAGPVTCLAPPSGRGFDATARAGEALPANGGFVVLGAWDDRRAEGSLDVSFAAAVGGGPAGRLSGNFVAPRCP